MGAAAGSLFLPEESRLLRGGQGAVWALPAVPAPSFEKDFWEYVDETPTLMKSMPRWMVPKAYGARDHVFAANSPEDPNWDEYWGSSWLKVGQQFGRDTGCMDDDALAAEDVALLVAQLRWILQNLQQPVQHYYLPLPQTVDQLRASNTKINTDCINPQLDYYICMHVPAATTATSQVIKPTRRSGPTPYMPGIVYNCKSYQLIVSRDSCWLIYMKTGITFEQFSGWNTQINAACSSFWLGYYVCVGLSAGALC
ncbi:hypothetical protein BDV11DRAFT_168504 [Aspergillus similis]